MTAVRRGGRRATTDGASIHVSRLDAHVAVVEIEKPPSDFFDVELITTVADTYETFRVDGHTRAIVLAAAGKRFCAGMSFSVSDPDSAGVLYRHANRVIGCELPVVVAVEGAAIGGGVVPG
jgi:2-(1,2-epoxy-1,2-dihydrophenyl)acetyl-CoA isomerase